MSWFLHEEDDFFISIVIVSKFASNHWNDPRSYVNNVEMTEIFYFKRLEILPFA